MRGLVLLAAGTATPASAFPAPVTPSFPADLDAETITVQYGATQTIVRTLEEDFQGDPYPTVYWFKYTADGNSQVHFDTLGTNISSLGAHLGYEDGNYASAGFGTYDQTQIAVYNSAGELMGRNGYWLDDNGDSVLKYNPELYAQYYPEGNPELPQNAGFVGTPINYINTQGQSVDFSEVVTQGLTNLEFVANPGTNPHWEADPDDETLFDPTAGENSTYYGKNEYEVWETAIDDAINTTAGWRAGDRARYGPGAPWHQYGALPAGEYYVAVSSSAPTYSGHTSGEEVLQAPIHYDSDTDTADVPITTGPMGPFQYYLAAEGAFPRQWGYITLNITHTPIPSLVGDTDGDGDIDDFDLINAIVAYTGSLPGGTGGKTIADGDTDDDGDVDDFDLINMIVGYTGSLPASASSTVPEPATLTVLALGGLLIARRRRG